MRRLRTCSPSGDSPNLSILRSAYAWLSSCVKFWSEDKSTTRSRCEQRQSGLLVGFIIGLALQFTGTTLTIGSQNVRDVAQWRHAVSGEQGGDVGRPQGGPVGLRNRHATGILADADRWRRQRPGQEHPVTCRDHHARRNTGMVLSATDRPVDNSALEAHYAVHMHTVAVRCHAGEPRFWPSLAHQKLR